MNFEKKRIVIVGGGLAGLMAAYTILKTKKDDVQVVVYEARDRLGGRIKSLQVDNCAVDVGGFMVFPFYKQFKLVLKELDLLDSLQKINNKEFYCTYRKNILN